MPRTARKNSDSGINHVMLRGSDRKLIFQEDSDCAAGMGFVETWRTGMSCRQNVAMGDHYIFAANRSCLKCAVSKEILAKRGLVSCFDHYMSQHALKLNRTAGCRNACLVV